MRRRERRTRFLGKRPRALGAGCGKRPYGVKARRRHPAGKASRGKGPHARRRPHGALSRRRPTVVKARSAACAAAGYEGKGLMWQGPHGGEGHTREGAKRACASHAGERAYAHTSSVSEGKGPPQEKRARRSRARERVAKRRVYAWRRCEDRRNSARRGFRRRFRTG